jgi:hypothetical protein
VNDKSAKKWIADRRAKARRIVPLDAKLAAAYAGRYPFPDRIGAPRVQTRRRRTPA